MLLGANASTPELKAPTQLDEFRGLTSDPRRMPSGSTRASVCGWGEILKLIGMFLHSPVRHFQEPSTTMPMMKAYTPHMLSSHSH